MAKEIEVDLTLETNIEPTIQNLRNLKKELRQATAGSAEFNKISANIRDVEDALEAAGTQAEDFAGLLEQAPGPIGVIGRGLKTLELNTKSFGTALKLSGIGLLVGIVGGLAAAFNDNEKAQKKLQPILNQLQKILGGIFSVVEPLFDVFIDLAEKALPYVTKGIGILYSAMAGYFTFLKNVGVGVGKLLKGIFTLDLDSVKEGLSTLKNSFSEAVKSGQEAYKRFETGSQELTKAEKEELEKRLEAERKAAEERAKIQKELNEKLAKLEKERFEKRKKQVDEFRELEQQLADEERERELQRRIKAEEDQKAFLDKGTALLMQQKLEAEEARQDELAREKAAVEAKIAIRNEEIAAGREFFNILSVLGEKNKAIQKAALIANSALSIASIINNTNVGATKEVATKGIFGLSTGAILYARMALSIGSVVAATARGLKGIGAGGSAPSGSGGNTGGGGGTPRPESAAPQFNIVGNTGVNQVAQVLNRQQAPIQAYVVASQVTTQQALDRQIKQTASIA